MFNKYLLFFISFILFSCSELEQFGIDVFDENIDLTRVDNLLPNSSVNDAILVLQTALDNSDSEYIKGLGYDFGDDIQAGLVIYKDSLYFQVGKDRNAAFKGRINDRASGLGISYLSNNTVLLLSSTRPFSLPNRWIYYWSGNKLAKRSPQSTDKKPIFFDFSTNFVLIELPVEIIKERERTGYLAISFGLD